MKNLTLGVALFMLLTSTASADIPEKFTNLKILSQDTGKRELIQIMQDFSQALGMKCTDCHEIKTPGDFSSIDWASEKIHAKEIARGMMKMTQEINSKLLPAATGEHDFKVRCITCHHGVEVPRTLDKLLLRTIAQKNSDAGEAKYRELREIYYGSGSYDFRPKTLVVVAQELAQKSGDMEGARKMINLNLEMNPDSVDSYLMLAQMDMTSGDKDAARANVAKALELDPESSYALRLKQQLRR